MQDHAMKREDVRRENARILAKEVGGLAEFARKTGMESSQVSQLIGRTPKKNIGNIIAQRIEDAYGLTSGWLDIPAASERLPAHSVDLPGAMRVVVQEDNSPEQYLIPKVALRLQAGISGFKTEADTRDNGVMGLPRSWVEKKGYDPARLLAIEVRGESMEPTFYEGDTVVINLADTQKMDNAVYAVNYDGEAVVKRLSRDQRQWWLMSDNADQRRFYRRACQGAECIIIGRIVRREGDHF